MIFDLKRVTGIACPACGCEDSTDWGTYRLCRHCGKQFAANAPLPRCPKCGSAWTRRGENGEYECLSSRDGQRCGQVFVVEEETAPEIEPISCEPVVSFVAPLKVGATCPECGRHPVPAVSSPKSRGTGPRVRYHKCPCGWRGKSQEGKIR